MFARKIERRASSVDEKKANEVTAAHSFAYRCIRRDREFQYTVKTKIHRLIP